MSYIKANDSDDYNDPETLAKACRSAARAAKGNLDSNAGIYVNEGEIVVVLQGWDGMSMPGWVFVCSASSCDSRDEIADQIMKEIDAQNLRVWFERALVYQFV